MRRWLFALVCLFTISRPTFAAITHVGGNIAACGFGTSCTVTYTSTTGNLLFVYITSTASNTTLTITDSTSGSNTYTALAQSAGSSVGVPTWKAFYSPNITSATTFTVTPGATSNLTIGVEEYAGVATASPLDAEATRGACFSGCTTTLTATALTTLSAGDVVACSYAADSGVASFTAGTIGGTTATQERSTTNSGILAMEDLILTGTVSSASATATANTTPSSSFIGCAAFKASGGGGGGGSTGCKNGLVLLGAGCDDLEDEPRAILPDSRKNNETKVPLF